MNEKDHARATLALFYHDTIRERYQDQDPEQLSLMLFTAHASGHMDTQDVTRIQDAIRATRWRAEIPSDRYLSTAVADCDLSVLGCHVPEDYDQYAAGVFNEYKDKLSFENYKKGRAKFLQEAIGRASEGKLFYTGVGKSMYAAKAVDNMARELKDILTC